MGVIAALALSQVKVPLGARFHPKIKEIFSQDQTV